ncbi:MAG: caspase family protein [Desulfobacterales bacterium]|nr:caspase family protein [Desulfobacterales bacterium]
MVRRGSATAFSLCGRYILIFLLLMFISACGHSIRIPDPAPSAIRIYKSVRLPAGTARMKPTGVILNKNERYTIMATGSIDYCPNGRCNWRDVRPEMGWPLMTRVGDSHYLAPLLSGTNSATWKTRSNSGELFVGYKQGAVDSQGEPKNRSRYEYDAGAFYVNIIVWNTEDWTRIADALAALVRQNPENKPLAYALTQAERFRDIETARADTVKELEKTRKQIDRIQKETEAKTASSSKPSEPPAWSSSRPAEQKPPAAPSRQDDQVARLQAKMAELTAMLAKLEETQKALEVERDRSQELSAEIDAFEEREKELLSKLEKTDAKPPVVVIAEPADGAQTEARQVALSLVAEDDAGIERVEIVVNGRPLSDGQDRGMVVAGAHRQRRVELRRIVALSQGQNRIVVRAVDTDGVEATRTVTLERIERRRNIWAVVVGINAYRNVRPLSYAVDDARAFCRLLIEQNRVPEENVLLLLDEEATLPQLRSVMGTHLKSRAGEQDTVLIFFAGHGAAERDVSSPDGDGLEKYLLPVEADPNDLYASALPMREVSHIFRRIRAERLVFIVDACYSGAAGGRTVSMPGFRAQISDAFLERLSSGKGRVILTASGANEVSAEKAELGHGVFSHFLLQGLKGPADVDGDGLVTVDELYDYVSTEVPRATGQEQHPVRKGTVEGRLVVGIVP